MNSRIKELINPLPGYTILHVSLHVDEITLTLNSMLEKVGGRLNFALYNSSDVALPDGNVRIQKMDTFDELFRALPRDNDIVIIHDVLSHHSQKDRMLKNAYMTLANAGQIVIIEKKGVMDIQQIKEHLEAHEFRAANEIELLEGYDLVVAKKMHMWGNGL
jgi:predicted nicotinamide N-methyase